MFLAIFLLILGIPNVSAYTNLAPISLSAQPTNQAVCVIYTPVTVFLPTRTAQLFSCEQSANSILNELGEDPNNFEVVHDYLSENGRNIIVVAVKRTKKLVWQRVSFPTEITYTKSLPHRKKVITSRGATGLNGIISEETVYADGTKKTKILDKWVEREPRTEFANVGTKYDLKTTVVNGVTIHYWGTLLVKATSYDHTCYGCNDTTATGAKLRKGIVAVDPKVIAMHSQMYIPGYGFGKAEDTGGKVKGNRIDLAYDDIRYGDWSKRWVTVYLID